MNEPLKIHPHLAACPFCGCPEVNPDRPKIGRPSGWVTCDHCGAEGPEVFGGGDDPPTIEAIAAAWNTRAALAGGVVVRINLTVGHESP